MLSTRYWERGDGRLLEHSDKYRTDNMIEKDMYKAIMQLNITRINMHDFTSYHCVAKNDIGQAKGELKIYRKFEMHHF